MPTLTLAWRCQYHPSTDKDFDRMVMHHPENIEKQEEKQWQCGYKVEASLNDRILSDKGYLR